jgi:hypothetical protein
MRSQLGRRAYDFSRAMVWPEVGARYVRIFSRVGAAETRPIELAERSEVGYGGS